MRHKEEGLLKRWEYLQTHLHPQSFSTISLPFACKREDNYFHRNFHKFKVKFTHLIIEQSVLRDSE